MKKILIIPSWYPLDENQLPGLFFREQALLLKDNFDFRVLYGKKKSINIFQFLFFQVFKKKNYLNIYKPPEGIGFLYLSVRIPFIIRHFTPIVKYVEKVNYFFMIKKFIKELKKMNWTPDLIHAQTTFVGGIVAHALSGHLTIPFIITEHQVFLPGNFSNYTRKLIRRALETANRVLAVSEHQKRQILMNCIDCEPIVVGNLVDENIFYPQNSQIDNKGTFSILFVSYNSYIKDNKTFFKVLKYLIESHINDLRVLIIGGDFGNIELIGEENPLYKLAKKYKVSEYVEFLNFIDREDMPNFYNQCDVLVSTSIAETFGVAQVEAMMCGIPVISTANGGIDDFITNENGIKVPIKDYKALAEAIIKIKDKIVKFDKMEVRGSVIRKYGRAAFSEKLKDIYAQLLT